MIKTTLEHLKNHWLFILAALLIFCAAAGHSAPIRTVTATIARIKDGYTV